MKNILVTRSSMPTLEEYVDEIKELWDSHWLTNMGKKHCELEKKMQDYLRVEHIELVTNGHMALELVMQSMGLKGEVITTPFTFASTTEAIIRSGLTPVFCDVNPDDYTIDVNKIEELITENTCAILPVHVYGNVCDVEKIDAIAKKHNLKVIYDAAHTFGEQYKGKGIGSYGDASCFSFHATKVYNTIEGGAICYNDVSLGKQMAAMKDFGISENGEVTCVGTNAKMNEFCAAMGICNLRHLDEEISKRKKVAELYDERLRNVKGVKLNCKQSDLVSNYAYYPIVIDKSVVGFGRDELYEKLVQNNIYARKYFYPLTSQFPCFAGKYGDTTPVARYLSESVLTLPMYADLEEECVEKICDVICGYVDKEKI